MTPDWVLEQMRELVRKPLLSHEQGDSFALYFEWLDEYMQDGKVPTDWDTRATADA